MKAVTDGKEEAQHHWPSRSTQISNRAKCSPVCPFENDNCCMARLLSKQEDFTNQVSMLETVIREAGHECIFLPKFHCELNPIEMVSSESFQVCFYEVNWFIFYLLQYWGWAKYQYRQVSKNTFKDAKDAAEDALINKCPVELIRRFHQSIMEMDVGIPHGTHGKGRTVGCTQAKGSSQCLEYTAMMHLDAVLNKS